MSTVVEVDNVASIRVAAKAVAKGFASQARDLRKFIASSLSEAQVSSEFAKTLTENDTKAEEVSVVHCPKTLQLIAQIECMVESVMHILRTHEKAISKLCGDLDAPAAASADVSAAGNGTQQSAAAADGIVLPSKKPRKSGKKKSDSAAAVVSPAVDESRPPAADTAPEICGTCA